jgi:nucleoid-associated protein EbfC
MSYRGGFGGGGFNMNNLMQQAKKMQEDMQKAQEELENATVEASVGGGMVTVVMNGKKVVKSVKIKKEAVDPEDVEMLEDLVLAAFNEACTKADELYQAKMPQGLNGLM